MTQRFVDERFLVLAASYKEAKAWARERGVPWRRCKYASEPKAVDGIANMTVVTVDGYRRHPLAERLSKHVMAAARTGHVGLAEGVRLDG